MITEAQIQSAIRREIKKADTRLKKAEKDAADAKKEAAKLKHRLDLLIVALCNRDVIDREVAQMLGLP